MPQSASTPEAPRLPASTPVSSELRSAATRPCPTCGAPASISASICPACGDSLPARNKQIRCRRCGGKASAMLVICPHCGRELQPAPPRLLTWGAPLLLVILFSAVLLAQLGGSNPASWTQRQMERASTFIGRISSQLQTDLSITMQPLDDNDTVLVSQPAPPQQVAAAETASDAPADASGENAANPENSDVVAAPPQTTEAAPSPPADAPANTPNEAPTDAPTDAPTAPPPTETPTTAPTETPAAAPTATPTATSALTPASTVAVQLTASLTSTTPGENGSVTATTVLTGIAQAVLTLPTPTPAPPTATPRVHRIRAGDTLFELALANDISLELLLAANNLSEDDVYTIQPGDEIIIPEPDAFIEAPATETPSPTPVRASFIHTVQPGDTLMAIGMRYGVNLQRILDANGMTLAQARSLRPGQELIIPGDATPTPAATPTPTAQPAANAAFPTATPGSAVQTSALRLDPPTLRSPEDQAALSCQKVEQLVWNPVPAIQPADLYVVSLGYVSGRDASGADQITWVIAQQRPSNVTLWQLDATLCGLAPFDQGRQWRWYVTVHEKTADGTLTPVSPASEMWGFTWQ